MESKCGANAKQKMESIVDAIKDRNVGQTFYSKYGTNVKATLDANLGNKCGAMVYGNLEEKIRCRVSRWGVINDSLGGKSYVAPYCPLCTKMEIYNRNQRQMQFSLVKKYCMFTDIDQLLRLDKFPMRKRSKVETRLQRWE